jgi:integrase
MRRKRIPTGSVFQQRYKDRHGKTRHTKVWYLKYYVPGNPKPKVESAETESRAEAVRILRNRMAALPTLRKVKTQPELVTMNQLFDDLITDHRLHNRKSLHTLVSQVDTHLRPALGDLKAQELTSLTIRDYTVKRTAERAANSSINRELSLARRAMKLGARQEPPLVTSVPHFDMLPVDNAREGTLPSERYEEYKNDLPDYARIAFVIGYHTGARKGEILSILRDKIDRAQGRIMLPGRTTKNGRPRFLPIYGDMVPEIERALQATEGSDCPYLVQHKGKRIKFFDGAWENVASEDETLFHDLRRTALTNMIEAGLSEKEAMEISGHKTRSVFDRYHIVSGERMQENAAKLEKHLKAKGVGK